MGSLIPSVSAPSVKLGKLKTVINVNSNEVEEPPMKKIWAMATTDTDAPPSPLETQASVNPTPAKLNAVQSMSRKPTSILKQSKISKLHLRWLFYFALDCLHTMHHSGSSRMYCRRQIQDLCFQVERNSSRHSLLLSKLLFKRHS